MVVLRCRDSRPHLRLSPLPLCAVLLLIYVRILFELYHDSMVLVLTYPDLWPAIPDLLVSCCFPLVPRSDLIYVRILFELYHDSRVLVLTYSDL